MSATIVTQGGRAHQEQTNMCLAWRMANMAKGGFSYATIKETHQLIKNPCTEVQEEKKCGFEFPGQKEVNAVIERHLAMVYKNHMDRCFPCHNGTAMNLQTRWRSNGTSTTPLEPAAPPSGTPPLPGISPAPPGDTDGNESHEIEGMPYRCVYIHSPHPNTQFFHDNAYAKDGKRDKDFIPDLLSPLSAAWKYLWHWFWRRQQPFEWISEWRRELIERNGSFEDYHYLQLANTLKYILKDILICTIGEQCSDKWKRTWRG